MKKFSIFLFLTLIGIWLLFPSVAQAQVNIIENWDGETLNKIIENFGPNAWVIVVGNPEDQVFVDVINSYSFNWVIRGYAHWLPIGKEMFNHPESAAQKWNQFFRKLNKKVYFQPWNEPTSINPECYGEPLENCVSKIVDFINALDTSKINLTTPSFDPHNQENTATNLIRLMKENKLNFSKFNAITINVYDPNLAKSYKEQLRSWEFPYPDLPIIFTETGLLSYDAQDICQNMYCAGVIEQWQSDPQVIGWAIFSNYQGWNLWYHPCVIDALKGNCHCQDCGPIFGGKKGLSAPNCQINLNEYRHCQWASANPVCPEILPQFGNCIMDQAQKESEQTILSQKERYRQNTKIKFDFEGNIASPPGEENSITQEFTGDGINAPLTKVIGDFFLGVASIFFRKIPDQIFFLTFHQPWRAITTMQLPITHRLPWNLVRALKNDFIHSILEEKSHDIIIGYANLEENNKVFCSAQPVREISRPVYASEIGCSNQTKSFEKIIIQSDGSWEIVSKPLTQQQLEFCDKIYGLGHLEAEKITGGSYREKYKDLPEEILQFCEHYSANRLHALAIQALGGIIPSMTLSFTEAAEGGMPKPGPGYGALADSIRPAINPVWKVFLPKKQRVELEKKPHPIEATKETKTTIKSKTFAGQVNKLTNFFKNIKITFFNQETRKTVHPDAVVKNYDLFNRQKDEVDTFFRYFIPKKVQKDQPFTLVREKDEEVPDITDPNGDLFVQYLRPYRWQKLGI